VKWSLSKNLAESKVVKSSFIWLFIVPVAARTLSSLDDVIDLTMFGASMQITTSLPFSWQLLFLAACCFTVANILYSVFCPDILKQYQSFSEFKEHSKTLLQVNGAMKNMVWSNKIPGIKPNYTKQARSYFKHYCDRSEMSERDMEQEGLKVFDNIDLAIKANVTNNAFYFVQNIADEYNPYAIKAALIFYGIGLLMVSIIAIENIVYVVRTFG
jgi:hypothetical protein